MEEAFKGFLTETAPPPPLPPQGDSKIEKNKVVKTRKPHTCALCNMPIPMASWALAITVFRRQQHKHIGYYFCSETHTFQEALLLVKNKENIL